MLVVAVMYPGGEDIHFDHDYYLAHHMPLVRRLWEPLGLRSTQVMRGCPGPDGAAPAYLVTTLLTFDGMGAFKEAASQHGAEIFADIPRFFAGQPALLFNETVG